MSLKIKRIFLSNPNKKNEYSSYENQLQPRILFGYEELETLFRVHEQEIMKIVEQEISDYINCDELCNDENDMFPKRCILTGEWYLRAIYFENKEWLSISTAFIGKDLGYKDDYLGLEVVFSYDENSERFVIDGINSESL